MSTSTDFTDTPLSDMGLDELLSDGFDLDAEIEPAELYNDPSSPIDYRLRQLSYSSLLTLHACPRKFQLQRLKTTQRSSESLKTSITFAFGHVVGEGIALALQGLSFEEISFKLFLVWHTPSIFDEDEKAKKSLWHAFLAIKKFIFLKETILEDYELVSYNGIPACELSFCINLPDGFRYRGYVDAVLKHVHTGEILVLECKTTGAAYTNPAIYKNSAQAIGYSIVLDHLYPELSSYNVLYLVYNTKQQEYNTFPFTKTYLQRALWLREMLLDVELIKTYHEAEIFPMRGETCFSFMRECEYINTCALSTASLTNACTVKDIDTNEYQVNISLMDLLESQMNKVS